MLNNRLVTAAIAGPRTEAQWEDYVGALSFGLTPEDEALVDRLVSPGHPSTPGLQRPGLSDRGTRGASAGGMKCNQLGGEKDG